MATPGLAQDIPNVRHEPSDSETIYISVDCNITDTSRNGTQPKDLRVDSRKCRELLRARYLTAARSCFKTVRKGISAVTTGSSGSTIARTSVTTAMRSTGKG